MGSEENNSARSLRTLSGSLPELQLGAQSVWELTELVNWENCPEYKPKPFKPWVEINGEPSSGALKELVSPTADPPSGDSEPADAEVVSNGTTTHEELDDMRASSVAAGTESVVASSDDAATEETAETVDATSEVEHSPGETQPNETEATSELTDIVDEDVLDSVPLPKAEQLPASAGEGPSMVSASQVIEEAPQASVRLEPAVTVSRPRRQIADSSRQVANQVATKPEIRRTTRGGVNIMTKATVAQHENGNEYLQRLESLVVQLNWQLAQQAQDEPASDADYIQWLNRRIVDLSLENMSLHEQLRQWQHDNVGMREKS